MSARGGRLTEDAHALRLREKIIPDSGLDSRASYDSPRAIILAGQPGAGKRGLAREVTNELHRDVIRIDPDELRDAHPDVERLRQQHPYTWAGHTHEDASQWAKELRAAAIEGRRNIILDTTLGNGDSAVTLIKDLQAKGYVVEVRGVVAHRLESELGVDARFTGSIDNRGYGRYVPEDVRHQVYDALPTNLDKVHAETGIPIRLYGREGGQVYDSHSDARLPGTALEAERQARLSNPRITEALRDDWKMQGRWHAELPDTLPNNRRVSPATATAVFDERAALKVVEGIAPLIREARSIDHTVRVRPNMVRGAVVGGTAATAFEAATEGAKVADLYARDNPTGAEAALLDFGARSVGGWTGAAVGAKAGTLVGIESGPGAIVTGIIGAGLGAWGASEVVDWIEKYRINNQTDSAGRVWTFDPEHPSKGWTHSERAIVGTVGTVADRPIYGATTQLTADAALTQELNYKASSRAVELRLSAPDLPIDPYRIDSDATDTPSLLPRSWERNPDSGEWRREVVHQVYEHGIKSTTVEVADATKAAQLDETAHGIMAFNAARSPVAFAKQYEQAYTEQGWSKHGPIPEAVAWTRDHPDQVLASDGRTYQHRPDGQWLHDGYIHDSLAEGNIRDELNETFSQIQAIQKQDAPVPDSPVPEPVDDPAEREALQPTPTTPATPTQPGHPDHPLYQQVRDGVAALDARHGRSFDATSERMTASLLVLAKDNGLDRVDHVLLSNATAHEQAGHTLFVVQGEPGNPAHQRASMPTIQAAQTPVDESMQQFEVVSREHDQRAQVQQREQQMHDERMQQENHGRALSMG